MYENVWHFDPKSTPLRPPSGHLFAPVSLALAPKRSGNPFGALPSEFIGYLVSQIGVTSSALWRKEIFSTLAQLVTHF